MTRFSAGLLLVTLSLATPVAAQQPGAGAIRADRPQLEPQRGLAVQLDPQRGLTVRPAPPRPLPADDANAQETIQRLQQLLQQYPPSLGHVLALDPTLLNSSEYLQPYPQLETFLAQHPDVAHNPGFYFDQQIRESSRRNDGWNDPKIQAIRALDGAFAGLALLVGFITVVTTIAWLIRTVIEHRKWQRVTATHVDTHTKLMDRLTSNEDLIAYMQSTAGRRFLESAPIPVDGGPRMLNAPFGRILWSVQAGVVVAFLGAGLIYASTRLASSEIFSMGELPIFVIGCAAVAVGAGFFISAIAAYGLSHRLGLFPGSGSTPSDSGTGHAS